MNNIFCYNLCHIKHLNDKICYKKHKIYQKQFIIIGKTNPKMSKLSIINLTKSKYLVKKKKKRK